MKSYVITFTDADDVILQEYSFEGESIEEALNHAYTELIGEPEIEKAEQVSITLGT